MNKITEKFSVPTKLDFATYGSIVKSITDHGEQIYIQVSRDEEKPQWVSMGTFLEKSLSELSTHGDFLKECLNLYHTQESIAYKSISNIMRIMNIM